MLRGLGRTPLFTVGAVLSLALGIGANSAAFSLLDQVLLRRLPVRNPGELVDLYSAGPQYGSLSGDEPLENGPAFNYPTFLALQKRQTVFTGLAGAYSLRATLVWRNDASYGTARMVSGNYFDVVGVRPAIGRLLAGIDPALPASDPVTMRMQIDRDIFDGRVAAALTGTFAGLAAILAAIGLYSVLAFSVARRTREIGIRMALGAQARQVRALVLRETAAMISAGGLAGIVGAEASSRLMTAWLYETNPRDSGVYAAAFVTLGLVALAATLEPMRRATKIEAAAALHSE